MLGFGGAFTESSAYVWSTLNATVQQRLLDLYFSKEGLQYSLGRIPIGSCDFALAWYSYDEVRDDANLTHFTVSHEKKWRIPFIRAAIESRSNWTTAPFKFVASPWSPPKWMKTNDFPYCPTSCFDCQLKAEYRDTYAMYMSKFITAFDELGVPTWAVTVQNEPEACPLLYAGMHFNPETERDFVRDHLGPRLANDHPAVKILAYDHNKDHVAKWAKVIYADAAAARYVWGTAVHWYTGDEFENVNATHYLAPDKPILATEATVAREKDPRAPAWENGEHYAHDMIGDFNNWVVGFIDWNLVLDMYGGPDHAGPAECEGLIKCGSDAMILADNSTQELYLQIFYYYMGHFRSVPIEWGSRGRVLLPLYFSSKFVSPGSVRVGVSASTNDLESTAFVTPANETVVIVLNRQDSATTYKLLDRLSGKAARITVPAHSIQTLVY